MEISARMARILGILPFVCGLGLLAFWVFAAGRQVLWMDEFHSLHHARAETWGDFFRSVRADNHPPLSFALMRWMRSLFGEGEVALRLPSIAAGLGIAVVLWRTNPGPRGILATTLFALSSFTLVLVTDARMYAWLALAVTGLWIAAERAREEGKGYGWAFLWCLIGLHTHYFFLHSAFVVVLLLGLDFGRRPERRGRILRLAGAMAASLVAFLPWFIYGMRHQLGHGLIPGRSHTRLVDYAASIAHYFFMDVGAGGPSSRVFAILGLGLLCPVAFVFLLTWREREISDRRRLVEALALALGAPLVAFIAANLIPRAGYNWKYVAGGAPMAMWIVASSLDGVDGLRRLREWMILVIMPVLCMFMGSVAFNSALDAGREDHRSAAIAIANSYRRGEDAIFVEPTWFPNGDRALAGWQHYASAGRLDPELAEPLEALDPKALGGRRVFILHRKSLPEDLVRGLGATHELSPAGDFGPDLSLSLFVPRPD